MILLALLLLAVAIALIVVAVIEGTDSVAFEVFNRDLDTTLWGVFVAGVVTGLIALTGLVVLVVGIRRVQARRKEIEYLRRKVAQQEQPEVNGDPDAPVGGQPAGDWIDQGSGRRRRPADA